MHRMAGVLLCFLFGAVTALPQTIGERLTAYQKDLDAAKAEAAASLARHTAVGHLLDVLHEPSRFVTFAYGDVLFDQAVSTWDRARVDKQIGSTASSSGTTDLVSRPSTPELFGLGVQLGAFTQTVSGNVVTFRGNADGIIRGVAGEPVSCIGCTGTRGLKNLAFAVSFDLSRQGTQQASTSGSATSTSATVPPTILLPKNTRQLSSFNARYDIYNPKDTRSAAFQKAWAKWFSDHQEDLRTAGAELLTAVSGLLDPLVNDTKFADLRAEFTIKLDRASATDVEPLFAEYTSKALALARSDVPNFDQKLLSVRAAYAKYAQTYDDAFKELRGKPQFSAEYTFDRPVNQPETHNARLIFGFNPFNGAGLFSANAAATLYGGRIPTGARYGRLRDFQLAAQFDRPLGNINTHPAVFTLAGYVQYQFDPSVIKVQPGMLVPGTTIMLPQDAQVLLGKKGILAILQAKVTLKLKDSGVRIPIGVSWSNRTDLLSGNDVRGHIGITYDLDALLNH